MEVIKTVKQIQDLSNAYRGKKFRISLVPTMGFLHEGHLKLMRVAKADSSKLIMSLFVNPTQFGPSEDFAQYPRNIEGDLEKARQCGVDTVFLPTVKEMYPEGYQTTVMVNEVSRPLCGRSRPGHFDGVTTVVLKLFNCTKPHVAFFGQKDFQQVAVIRRMVLDLNLDVEITAVPTIREADGLAMSSRNSYLSANERPSALSLKKGLDFALKMFKAGTKDADTIKKAVVSLIEEHPFTAIDYVSLCDPVTLEDVTSVEKGSLLALAVRVGKTRLIDNCLIQ